MEYRVHLKLAGKLKFEGYWVALPEDPIGCYVLVVQFTYGSACLEVGQNLQ